MENSEVKREYSYDRLNRLVAVTYEDGRRVTYSYDGAGNLTSVSPEGATPIPAVDGRFQTMVIAYREMRQRLDSGQLTPEGFQEQFQQLGFQDQYGVWWHVREADGGWLKWDGTAWIEAVPPNK